MKHSTVDLCGSEERAASGPAAERAASGPAPRRGAAATVHFADFGGSGPPLVLVHGLGGSWANWMAVGSALAERFRVLAPDLPGFGRTPPVGRPASISDHVDLVARFIERVAGGRAVIAGNSMGGLIAALLAARRPDAIERLVLVNPALPRPLRAPIDRDVAALFAIYMTPLLGRAFLRRREALGPERSVRDMLRLCGVDTRDLPPDVLAAQLSVARDRLSMPWAHDAFLTAARSLVAILARRRRFDATLRAIRAPALLLQGARDRLVPLAAAEAAARLRPDWEFVVLDGVGHVPQLEVPARWLEVVLGWLTGARARPGVARARGVS